MRYACRGTSVATGKCIYCVSYVVYAAFSSCVVRAPGLRLCALRSADDVLLPAQCAEYIACSRFLLQRSWKRVENDIFLVMQGHDALFWVCCILFVFCLVGMSIAFGDRSELWCA